MRPVWQEGHQELKHSLYGRKDYCQLGNGEEGITLPTDRKRVTRWDKHPIDLKLNTRWREKWAGWIQTRSRMDRKKNRKLDLGWNPNQTWMRSQHKRMRQVRLMRTKAGDTLWETEIPPCRFPEEEYILLTQKGEPKSFKESKWDAHNKEWLHGMQD